MEKFFKFGIYEQLGYLLVGAVAELVIYLNLLTLDVGLPDTTFTNLAILMVVAFFLGHFCQAVANLAQAIFNRFRKRKDPVFSDAQKKVLRRIIAQYGLERDDYNEAFAVCMALTKWKDVTGEVGAFNANYGLYRGWTVVAFVNMLYGLALVVMTNKSIGLLTAVISLFVAVVFGFRSKLFYKYTARKVFHTFRLIEVNEVAIR